MKKAKIRWVLRLIVVALTGLLSGYCAFGVGFPAHDIGLITIGQIGLLLSVVHLDIEPPK